MTSTFLDACLGRPVPHTPVWFMRQAGRSLPEYHELRRGIPMLESCRRPDLVTEITLQPVRRYGVDAAILYSDIMVPLKAIGIDVDIKPDVGPVMGQPLRTAGDVDLVRDLEPDDVPYVDEAVRALVGELAGTPLIAFAGAPFTLASYLVEGGPSRTYAHTKALMHREPALWHRLLDRLASVTIAFLRVQLGAGASAVQVFDSWAGALAPADYERFVLPHTRRIFAELAPLGVPRIHFGVGTGEMLDLMAGAGVDVIGVDWRVPLDESARRTGHQVAVQGNLDPALVFAPWEVIAEQAGAALRAGQAAPGHVFNLGHGVLPDSDPDVLARLVEFVHAESATAQAPA